MHIVTPTLPNLVKKILADVKSDHCVDLAAQMSFYFVLSLFPFLLVLGAIVGWLPATNLWQEIARWITDYLPPDSRRLVFETILDLAQGYKRFLSFGLLAALWSASSGFVSLMESLSLALGIRDTRGFWEKRAIAVCATVVGSAFFLTSFALVTLGHWLGMRIWLVLPVRIVWELARWVGSLGILLLGLGLINHYLVAGYHPWRWWTPGTIVAATNLLAGSAVFNFYLRHFGNFPKVYGELAGFVILVTWIYVSSLGLLLGAETDNALGQLKSMVGERSGSQFA